MRNNSLSEVVELLCLQNCRSLQKQTYSCKEQFIVSFSLHLCSMICTTNLITFDHRNFIMDMKCFEILDDKKKMTLLFIDFGKVVTVIVIEAWCSGHTPITICVYIMYILWWQCSLWWGGRGHTMADSLCNHAACYCSFSAFFLLSSSTFPLLGQQGVSDNSL